MPQVTIVFGDFVFEDQVIPKRVPGKLSDQAVILMSIQAPVGKHQVRNNTRFQYFESLLECTALVREKAVAEVKNLDFTALRSAEKPRRARPRLPSPNRGSAEDHPMDAQAPGRSQQLEEGTSTPDFNVIGVGAETQHLERRTRRPRWNQREHVNRAASAARSPL